AAARKPEETAAANRAFDDGLRVIQEAVKYLEAQAEQLKQKQPNTDIRARMLYETAWGYRNLADAEVAAVRTRMKQELQKKKQEETAKKNPNTAPPTVTALPEIALSAIPLQPAE